MNPFIDVYEDDWFYYDVMFAYSRGLMLGTYTDPMLFSPLMNMTRGMIVTILFRIDGSPGALGMLNPFIDVAGDAWYADPVRWAYANGIIEGYSAELFGPDDHITREQLAAIFHRYASHSGLALPAGRDYADFGDEAIIETYAKEAVKRLYMAEVINGKPGNLFDPKGLAARSEAAAMLRRLLQ